MTTSREVAAWYEARAVDHDRRAAAAGRRASTLSNARLGAFAALILAAAWLATTASRALPAIATAAAFTAFVLLVVLHRRARGVWRHARSLGALHRRGIARVHRDWGALGAPALVPPAGHPYARDLDVLGDGASLFALLDVVSAWPGRPTLSAWLLAPAPDADAIRARQRAAAELAARVELRHELALAAADAGSVRGEDVARFADWAAAPGWLATRPHVRWAARILPIAFLALALLAIRGLVPWTIAALPLFAAVLFITTERSRIEASFGGAMLRATGLRRQRALLALVRDASFDAPLLQALQSRIAAGGGAARQLRRLESVLSLAEVRYSPMLHGPLQLLLLWDVHVVARLERWQRTAGAHVRDWLAALGEVEALAALGTLAFDNPDWCFPDVLDERIVVSGEAVGHPLLAPDVRVANDVSVGPPGTLLVVTGSNMSGKSTLLRAIGLDAVLALAGGPVCARRFSLPLLDLWTSARIDDSLAQGMSLFMAELKRLQAIVEAARAPARPRPMLYLLDEILHGTNTAERQIAARTILHHLLRSGAIGAVTTHDLTLAAEPALADAARFVHFTEQFTRTTDGPRMAFDYRLRPGLATSTNAIRLLEMLGLADGG